MSRCDSTLDAILRDAGPLPGARVLGTDPAIVSGITHDSRNVRARTLFCCVTGRHHDGHAYAEAAIASGASALVVERPLQVSVPQVLVPSVRAAMGPLASAVFGHPSRRLRVVGVTGTNGKTTTSTLLAAILRQAGRPSVALGTLTGSMTTPEAPELQERLARLAADGITDVVMEVSSHALEQYRVDGTHFAAALFTNLSQDHLDLHGTMEAYFSAKCRLFEVGRSSLGVVNSDDEWGRRLLESATIPLRAFSAEDASDIVVTPSTLEMTWHTRHVEVGLGGSFNVMNVLAAATAASVLGVDDDDIVGALSEVEGVPGRFESIRAGQAFDVLVDYAHTPDGLRAVLETARAAAAGRLIVVFGCGGDRDRDKRPLMGAVAVSGADLVIVTSDNPRSEDPRAIIDAILGGIPDVSLEQVLVEQDRSFAIETALRIARPGDVVIVAGKGHETTQTIGDQVIDFDDRVVARSVLERMR